MAIAEFAPIEKRAAARVGGADALEQALPTPSDGAALRQIGDDRYLSMMCRRIFRAGLRQALVDQRWPAFEEVFAGFEPRAVVNFDDEALEGLMSERRIIRHWRKIKSVRDNAAAMLQVSAESGAFGAYLADWPTTDIVGLWRDLARRFSQMGGNSSSYFLRMVDKDTFRLTGDVVKALTTLGLIDRKPTSQKDLRRVQEAFNVWGEETGRPLCQLSRVLALSVD